MTDQELKDMLADLIASQKETDRILKEYAARAEEDRRMTDKSSKWMSWRRAQKAARTARRSK